MGAQPTDEVAEVRELLLEDSEMVPEIGGQERVARLKTGRRTFQVVRRYVEQDVVQRC